MLKNVLRTLTFAALFCILLTVSIFAEEAEITGSYVNFRSGPSTEYAIYDCLPKGTVVTVTDRSNSEWYAVTYDGRNGFISSTYLTVYGEPSPSAPDNGTSVEPAISQTNGTAGTVNAMYVRFRSGPGTDYSILGEYNSGTSLTVTGSSNGWYAVIISGQSGYMYADYVTMGTAEVPSEPTVVTPVVTPAPDPIVVTPTGDKAGHINEIMFISAAAHPLTMRYMTVLITVRL